MENKGLTQIVKDIQNNNKSFDILYPLIEKKIYFWCYTIVKNKADAEDVMQETIVLIYRKLHTLKDVDYFLPWMYRLVTNCCYRYLQKKKRKDKTFLNDNNFYEDTISTIPEKRIEALPKEIYDLQELKQIISTFISNLPRKQREAITLFYLEEFSINEISKILNSNPPQIKARLHYGRRNLEKQITDYQEKNNIKLYSIPLLTLLGTSLHEYKEEICSNQQFKFKYNLNNTTSFLSFIQKLLFTISYKTVLLFVIICISVIAISSIFSNQKPVSESTTSNPLQNNISTSKDGYNWILKVEYDNSLTRYDILISIELESSIKMKDIQVSLLNEDITFSVNKSALLVQATKNGVYEIQVKDENISIDINTIDKQAIELISVYNRINYIELIIDDPSITLDYKQSYVMYNGKRYNISNENKVTGRFKGTINIVLYNNDGLYILYDLEIE
ncbi:MAG: RNA polymerase sigma factor [Coprobacillaceae bacterium]